MCERHKEKCISCKRVLALGEPRGQVTRWRYFCEGYRLDPCYKYHPLCHGRNFSFPVSLLLPFFCLASPFFVLPMDAFLFVFRLNFPPFPPPLIKKRRQQLII